MLKKTAAITLGALLAAAAALPVCAEEADLASGGILIESSSDIAEAEGEILLDDEKKEDSSDRGTGTILEEASVSGYAFDEVVLMDDDTVRFSVSSEDGNISDGYTWQIHLRNRTEDMMAVSFEDAALDEYMCAPGERGDFSWAMGPFDSVDAEITWSSDRLALLQKTEIGEVAFSVRLITSGSGEGFSDGGRQDFRVKIVQASASFGQETEKEPVFADETENTAPVSFSEDAPLQTLELGKDIRGSILSFDAGEEDAPAWLFLLENTGKKAARVHVAGAVVNGLFEDLLFDQTVLPGKKALCFFELWNLDYMNNRIEEVLEAAFDMEVWERGEGGREEYLAEGTYAQTVYPAGEAAAKDAAAGKEEEGISLFEGRDIHLTVTEAADSIIPGCVSLRLHVINQSKGEVTVEAGTEEYREEHRLPAGMEQYISVIAPVEKEIAVTEVLLRDSRDRKLEEGTFYIDWENRRLTDGIPEDETEEITEADQSEEGEEDAPDETERDEKDADSIDTQEPGTEPAKDQEDTVQAGQENVVYTDSRTICNVQEALNVLGYDCGTVDGAAGERTLENIAAFRSAQSLPEGTAIDRELLEALGTVPGDVCEALQEALTKAGYDCGKADGMIGEGTRKAVREYKEAHGMDDSSRIDRALLDGLGISWQS